MPAQPQLNGIAASYWLGRHITIILMGKSATPLR